MRTWLLGFGGVTLGFFAGYAYGYWDGITARKEPE